MGYTCIPSLTVVADVLLLYGRVNQSVNQWGCLWICRWWCNGPFGAVCDEEDGMGNQSVCTIGLDVVR